MNKTQQFSELFKRVMLRLNQMNIHFMMHRGRELDTDAGYTQWKFIKYDRRAGNK